MNKKPQKIYPTCDINHEPDSRIDTVSRLEPSHNVPVQNEPSCVSLQSPEDILAALEEALKMGHSEEAIKLAKLGTERFPDHPRLKRVAKVLAPPIIRTSQRPYNQSLDASREWLQKNAHQYRKQWVAVCKGVLIGNAPTMQSLLEGIGPNIDRDNTLITKVLYL